ncbi:hypothetical protein [Mesorhizobium sp. M1409]
MNPWPHADVCLLHNGMLGEEHTAHDHGQSGKSCYFRVGEVEY